MKNRLPLFFVVMMLGTVALTARAAGIPKARINTVTTTARWCAPSGNGARTAIQCEYPVYLTTGSRLSDAGTARSTDGGAPMVANPTGDELVIFPGDPLKVDLGISERCLGVLSADAGDGGNFCNFFERNTP